MSERPLILTLDGSTRVCGAALLCPRSDTTGLQWEVVDRKAEADGRGQARVLLRLVDEMLGVADAGPGDLGAIVTGTGPGTFTGVRITVATARALGLALSVPVLGVSTLAALAAGVAALDADVLVPVVDARRGQVFFAVYERGSGQGVAAGTWARSLAPGVCDRDGLGQVVAPWQGKRILVVGDERGLLGDLPEGAVFAGAEVEAEHLVVGQDRLQEPGEMPLGDRMGPWLEGHAAGPGPKDGGPAGGRAAAWAAGAPGSPESVKPIYVRSPDADVHITKMRDPWGDDDPQR